MKISDVTWTRGLKRLYLIVVIVWFSYWIIWVPLEGIRSWQQLALSVEDKTKQQEYWAHANLIAQWRVLAQEMIKNPFATIVVVFLPPALGYGILHATLGTVGWILRGFFINKTPIALEPTDTQDDENGGSR